MKQDIKNKDLRERKAYVPAKVKVFNVTVQRVICTSPGSVNDPFGSTNEEDI